MTKLELAAQILQTLITRSGYPRSEWEENQYIERSYNLARLFLQGPKPKEPEDVPSPPVYICKPESGNTSGNTVIYVPSGEPLEP